MFKKIVQTLVAKWNHNCKNYSMTDNLLILEEKDLLDEIRIEIKLSDSNDILFRQSIKTKPYSGIFKTAEEINQSVDKAYEILLFDMATHGVDKLIRMYKEGAIVNVGHGMIQLKDFKLLVE